MKHLPNILASLTFALVLSGAAYAQAVQGLDGRWEGKITLGNGAVITGVFRVTTKDGKTTTVMDSPDQGAKDIPAAVTRTGDKVVFEVATAGVTYTANLSADGKTLAGEMSQGGGSVPLTMTQKPASATAALTTPAVAGLDGRWEGALSTPVGDMPIVFRVSTAAGKTTTLMDSPSENISGIPSLAKRDGQKISIGIPGIAAQFEGELAADGKTINGFWNQSGQSLTLILTKK